MCEHNISEPRTTHFVTQFTMDKGYILFKVFEPKELPGLRKEFLKTCQSFPEFKEPVTDFQFVLGGFSALGNPSSFHNIFVRYVRILVYRKVFKFLKRTFPQKKVHCFFDRLLLRPTGAIPSKESWHRDVTPGTLEEDLVFGGWTNFDDTPQFFSCVPGTHEKQKNSGFVPVEGKFKGTKVEIPPGFGILFYQDLIHEVLPTKTKQNAYRLFHGFRVTEGTDPIFDVRETIQKQGVPQIPSGQLPPLYSKSHPVFHKEKLNTFSEKFKDICRDEKGRVHRFMKSLTEYGFPLYQPYHEKEIQIFYPR